MTAADDALDRLFARAGDMPYFEDLATVRDELQRLRAYGEEYKRQMDAAEAELQRLREELDEAQREPTHTEASEQELADAKRLLRHSWLERAEAAEAEVARLTEGLRGLLDEIGDPMDVDQDCRFCGAHYYKHLPACPWDMARALLADSPPENT